MSPAKKGSLTLKIFFFTPLVIIASNSTTNSFSLLEIPEKPYSIIVSARTSQFRSLRSPRAETGGRNIVSVAMSSIYRTVVTLVRHNLYKDKRLGLLIVSTLFQCRRPRMDWIGQSAKLTDTTSSTSIFVIRGQGKKIGKVSPEFVCPELPNCRPTGRPYWVSMRWSGP